MPREATGLQEVEDADEQVLDLADAEESRCRGFDHSEALAEFIVRGPFCGTHGITPSSFDLT